MDFAKKKFTSFFWSTMAVAVAFFFFFLCNVIGGLVGAIPYAGPILVAILSPFAFIGGFVMMLIAIGGIFGWPLMSPAVAAEGTDAFDAISRAFSYIYTRPWHYLFYWIITIVYGAFSVGFVWLFSALMVRLTIGSAHVGMGSRLDPVINSLIHAGPDKPTEMTVPQVILAVVLGTIIIIIYGLSFSYLISFMYSARTLMYFILRKKIDATEMTEVFLEEEEDDDFFSDDFEEAEMPVTEGESPEKDEACQEDGKAEVKEPEAGAEGAEVEAKEPEAPAEDAKAEAKEPEAGAEDAEAEAKQPETPPEEAEAEKPDASSDEEKKSEGQENSDKKD
jgi:hypothetical protein